MIRKLQTLIGPLALGVLGPIGLDASQGAPVARPAPTSEVAHYSFVEGAVFPVTTMPGRITDILLEPGEQLVGAGPIAAGDTARWIIGDTFSGAGASQRVHVMVKPSQAGLSTNLIINSDRRTYHLELRAAKTVWVSQVSWRYPTALAPPPPVLIPAPPARVMAPVRLNFAYRLTGARPPWRPLRVFDDGARTFIEFPPAVAMGDLPPLFAIGPDGKSAELVNYRIEERRMVADRLFDQAELRMGLGRWERRVRLIRDRGREGAAR